MRRTVVVALAALALVASAQATDLVMKRCNASDVTQTQWSMVQRGEYIQLKQGDLCLDCGDCAVGGIPMAAVCGDSPSQLWNASGDDSILFESAKGAGVCMRVPFSGYSMRGYPNLDTCEKHGREDGYTSASHWLLTEDGQIQNTVYGCCGAIFQTRPNCLAVMDAKSCSDSDLASLPFCQKDLPPFKRAQDLVSHMILEEKAENMDSFNMGVRRLGVEPNIFTEALHVTRAGCGASHDFGVYNSTGCPVSFPQVITSGASWNRTLWGLVGQGVSTETRAIYNQKSVSWSTGLFVWAPNVNPFRDPRWGRGQEVPSEDSFVCGEYAMRYIRGLQEGEDDDYLKLVATVKHYFAYDQEGSNGTDRQDFNAVVAEKDLADYFLPPFRAAVQGGKTKSMMCAYNAVNGVPSCGNGDLINNVFRDTWGFDGLVVSDCDALNDGAFKRYIEKYFNGSFLEQARVGVQAGTDLDCGEMYGEQVVDAVRAGVLPEVDVNQALERIFQKAIELGALDEASTYTKLGPKDVDTPANRQLALEAARQGIVLLKNQDTLPLELGSLKNIAVIGPHGNSSEQLLGGPNYRGDNTYIYDHTPYLEFKARFANAQVTYAQGCDFHDPSTDGFDEAVSAAKAADVALVFVGLTQHDENEGLDRIDLNLPGVQSQLIEQVAAVAKKTIVVSFSGGALSYRAVKENSDVGAIIQAFYPGMMGAEALADILIGEVSPAGRLPVTFYDSDYVATRRLDQYDFNLGNGVTYLHYRGTPLWEFGFGLSYTTFDFVWSDEASSTASLSTTEAAGALTSYYDRMGEGFADTMYSINVTNTGHQASDVVVLAFITSTKRLAADPLQELFGFERLSLLAPGETQTVEFSMPPPQVLAHGGELTPGDFEVRIGGSSSQQQLTGSLALHGPRLIL